MTVRELSERLADQAATVAQYLLPAGRQNGREWCVGSINGEPGKSLKVCIDGSKVGVWSDFAAGQSGDLVDLWGAVRGLGIADAVKEIKDYLGVKDPEFTANRRTYRRPDQPHGVTRALESDPVMAYLTKKRLLTPAGIAAYRIAATGEVGPWPSWKRQEPVKGPWIVFPFRRGDLLGIKYLHLARRDGKKFTLVEPGCEPTCFGWHAIDPSSRSLVICEGELDAVTLYDYGHPAVSVPFGGGRGDKQQWVDHDWEQLELYDEIFLVMDQDEAGETAVGELVSRLGSHRCRIVALPHKDPNECRKQGVTKEEIDKCFAEAKHLDPPSLRPAVSYTDSVIHEFYPPAGEQGHPTPWSHVPFRYLYGEVSLYTGWNGSGKSLALGQIMLKLMQEGERCVVASLEMRAERTLYRMTRQLAVAQTPAPEQIEAVMRWTEDKLWLYDKVGTEAVGAMLEAFHYAHRRFGCKHFVIDSLMKCGIPEDDYRGQKELVDRLCDFANQNLVHLHLVAHSRKRDSEDHKPGKLDIKGTGAISDLAFNVFTVWRHKKKEDGVADYQRKGVLPPGVDDVADLFESHDALLIIDKSRNVEGAEGKYPLWYHASSMQYTDDKLNRPTVYITEEEEPPPF